MNTLELFVKQLTYMEDKHDSFLLLPYLDEMLKDAPEQISGAVREARGLAKAEVLRLAINDEFEGITANVFTPEELEAMELESW